MTRKHTSSRRKNKTKNKKIKAKRNNRTLKGGSGSTINLNENKFKEMLGIDTINEPIQPIQLLSPRVLGTTPPPKNVAIILGDNKKLRDIERQEAEERLRRQADRREAEERTQREADRREAEERLRRQEKEERLQTNTQSSATLSDRLQLAKDRAQDIAQEIGGRTRDTFHQLGTQIASGIDEGREHLSMIPYKIAQIKMQKLKEKDQSILLEKQKLIEKINDSKKVIYIQLRALRDKTEIELPEPLLSVRKMRERIERTINPRFVETDRSVNNLQSMVNESKEASLILIKQHLNQFLEDFYSRNKRGNKPFPTYEDWVSNLHEDNVKGIYGVIDDRLYIENNDYLNIWNNNIEVIMNQKQFAPRPSSQQRIARLADKHRRNSNYQRSMLNNI
jgi:hypothetical protein